MGKVKEMGMTYNIIDIFDREGFFGIKAWSQSLFVGGS